MYTVDLFPNSVITILVLYSDRTQKHIQVNLSKEYFATFLNQEDNGSSTDGRAETSPHDAALAKPFSSDDTSKPSDNESGITPFAHDVSPIRGIMKNMTEVFIF